MIKGLLNSSVFWTGLVTLLRTGGFFLVLPLVLRKIPSEELGMWYVFLGIAQFSGIVELGFATNISRFASYFMGGALSPKSIGIDHATAESSGPNLAGLKGLSEMAMDLYPKLGGAMGLLMTLCGGWWLSHQFGHAFWCWNVAPAFFLYALGMTVNMYGYFWMNLLFGVNRIREGQQIFALGLVVNYLLCVVGLLLGVGLYALAIGQIALALVPRWLACRMVRRDFLSKAPSIQKISWRDLWPMTWRSGLFSFSTWLSLPVMPLICAQVLGLKETASYGLSLQLALMIHGLSASWMAVTYPRLSVMRTQRRYREIRHLVMIRVSISMATYIICGIGACFLAPLAIHLLNSKTEFLPTSLLIMLFGVVIFDFFLGHCNAILLSGNQVPQLGSTIFTGILAVSSAFVLGHLYGVIGIIIAPFCGQVIFNLWHTPRLCWNDIRQKGVLEANM
jgi:O-antigen/teichoic acid export membrane protein